MATLKKPKFALTHRDARVDALLSETDHKTLGVWARDCAERVLPYFETQYPDDQRPRQALEALQRWIDTGVFKMAIIR
ncbi:MAG: hypothetical protein K8I82_08225, partial [Anaerolineae bacterium]|nr:hypothetical protein [Anaerolineae bacterium]